MLLPVTRYEFFKDRIIYFSVVAGNAYCSLHKMGNLSKEQAKKAFHREHTAEVMSMVREKQKQNVSPIILNQHGNKS